FITLNASARSSMYRDPLLLSRNLNIFARRRSALAKPGPAPLLRPTFPGPGRINQRTLVALIGTKLPPNNACAPSYSTPLVPPMKRPSTAKELKGALGFPRLGRSEEHTSELQSRGHL